MILLTLVSLSSWALPTTPGGEVVSFSTTKRRLAKGSKKHQAMAPPTEAPRPSSLVVNYPLPTAPVVPCCEPPGEDWVCSAKKREEDPAKCCDATTSQDCAGACETAAECKIPFLPNPYCQTTFCTMYDGLDHPVCIDGQCQSGSPGARCVQTSDCIDPFLTLKNPVCNEGYCDSGQWPEENVPPTKAPQPSSPGENSQPTSPGPPPTYCCEPPGEDWVCSVKKRQADPPAPCCEATNTACVGACETATDCKIPFFEYPYCNHDYCTTYDGLDHPVCIDGQCQSGWTKAKCAQTSDCIVPLNLKEPVCRDAYCQSGQVGARCGGNDDCVDPYICDDTVEGGCNGFCHMMGSRDCVPLTPP